ncbi:calmodulin [Tribonema minus]|uniref:Calmodulin n=1 Tax=Tribonema minus TaxID=303371 RepID=A0A835Z1Q3_9STRA|nr:calmodulin [Tribonema minus]
MAAFTASSEMRELTQEELDDYKEAFDNFDKDGNGEIDEIELSTVMRSLGYNPTDEQLHDMMLNIDLDGNEFVTMMRKCEVETDFDREVREAFQVFDRDGSGAIDKAELTVIMKAKIELLVREADVDGDGAINLDEFIRIMYGGA